MDITNRKMTNRPPSRDLGGKTYAKPGLEKFLAKLCFDAKFAHDLF